MEKVYLHIHRQTGGHTLNINLIGMQSLWLQKQLMPLLIWESYQLGFNGRTVSRPHALNKTIGHRCPINIIHNNLMGSSIGIGKVAWHLLSCVNVTHKGEISSLLIPWLNLHFAIVKGTAIHSGWGTGFKTHQLNAGLKQGFRKFLCRTLSIWSTYMGMLTNNNRAFEISARSHNSRPAGIVLVIFGADSLHTAILHNQLINQQLLYIKIILIFANFLHAELIMLFVCLSS